MNKKILSSVVIFIAFTTLALLIFPSTISQKLKPPAQPPRTDTTYSKKFNVVQIITLNSDQPGQTVDIPTQEGETVLGIIAKTNKIETKEYSFGKLVESIDGVKNGTDNKYWIFYINGEESKIGVQDWSKRLQVKAKR
jgi:hypothetical protein